MKGQNNGRKTMIGMSREDEETEKESGKNFPGNTFSENVAKMLILSFADGIQALNLYSRTAMVLWPQAGNYHLTKYWFCSDSEAEKWIFRSSVSVRLITASLLLRWMANRNFY